MNAKEQEVLGASYALKHAEDRDVQLQHIMSLLAGAGLGMGDNVLHGLLVGGLGLGVNSPRLGTTIGHALNTGGKAAANPVNSRIALALRLAGSGQQ
jgi:hypothetical protein